ncbi:hypothetical protein Tsubulata_047966, partial [Turnera subulata]
KRDLDFDVLIFGTSSCLKEFQLAKNNNKKKKKKKPSHEAGKVGRNQYLRRGQSPLEVAKFYSPRGPHFFTTMKPSNGIKGKPYLNISSDFVESTNLNKRSFVVLRDPSRRLWRLKICVEPRRTCLRKGWSGFYSCNKLKEGDVCLFELDNNGRRSIDFVLDVRIFPKSNH